MGKQAKIAGARSTAIRVMPTMNCESKPAHARSAANCELRIAIDWQIFFRGWVSVKLGASALSYSFEKGFAAVTTRSFTASQFLRAKKRRICVRCNLDSDFMPTGTEPVHSPPNCYAGWSHARRPVPPAPTRRSTAPVSAHPGSESAAPSCLAPESSLAA